MSQCVVYGWKESLFALDELLNICCYTCDLNTIDTLFEWSAANGHVFPAKVKMALKSMFLPWQGFLCMVWPCLGFCFGLPYNKAF